MEKADWFGLLLAIVSLGAGAIMSTLGKRAVRAFGILFVAIGIAGLIYWFGYYRSFGEQIAEPTIHNETIDSKKSKSDIPFRTLPADPSNTKKLAPVILNEGTNTHFDHVIGIGAGTVLENKGKGLDVKNSEFLQVPPGSTR